MCLSYNSTQVLAGRASVGSSLPPPGAIASGWTLVPSWHLRGRSLSTHLPPRWHLRGVQLLVRTGSHSTLISFATALAGTLSGTTPTVPSWLSQSQDTNQPRHSPSIGSTVPPPPSTTASEVDAPRVGTGGPLRLPNTGLPAIPASLVKKISEGAFVDLGDLLPEALQWAFDRSTEEKSDKEKRKRFPIETIADWVMAFATFAAVRVQLAPELAVPLTTYLAIITRLAREVPGLAWQRYDRMFRQSAAGNPTLQWDRREPDIWLAAIAEQPKQPPPSFLHAIQPPASRYQPTAREICRRFSRGECPPGSYCRYRHICGICQSGGHPARDCPLIRLPARRPPPPQGGN